jgi:hypothetical protein
MASHSKTWSWFFDNISQQQPPNEKLMQHNVLFLMNIISSTSSKPSIDSMDSTSPQVQIVVILIAAPAYKKQFTWKKTVFTQINSKSEVLAVPTSSNNFDSDDDLSNLPVKVGDKVDF